MIERLEALLTEAVETIRLAGDLKTLEEIRVKYLGKNGQITEIMKGLGQVPADSRPQAGKACNEVKNKIAGLLDAQKEEMENRSGSGIALD